MAINMQAKTDYSYLFSNLGVNNSRNYGAANLNFLSDYALIKSGSYGKLMRAYYNEADSESVNKIARKTDKNTDTEEEKKELAKVETTTDALKESADALLQTGKKSVFEKKEVKTKDENGVETTSKKYDVDAIHKAVSNFVTDYNAVIDAVDNTDNKRVTDRAMRMANDTLENLNTLKKLGISMSEEGKLSLDKEAFQKADMETAKVMFNAIGSYGYRVSAQSSMINFTAGNEA